MQYNPYLSGDCLRGLTWKDSHVRNATTAALALGVLLWIVSNGQTQEPTVKTPVVESPAKAPLQILDECIRAVQQRDFATYVDHLSGDEQKMQAGYVLLLSSTILPQVEEGSEQIEPEMLLLLRAVGDLINEHTADDLGRNGGSPTLQAATQMLFEQVLTPAMVNAGVGYVTPQAVTAPRIREVFMKSAGALKDPRLFLIATLTEISRPVQVAGAEPMNHSESPDLAELAKEYERQDWTLYTRGDYAIAVPAKGESVPQYPADGAPSASSTAEPVPPPPAPGAPPASSTAAQSSWPLRIEFQKIDGVWKISHILPMSRLTPMIGSTAGRCAGPECNINTGYYSPAPAVDYPSYESGAAAPSYVPAPAAPYSSASPE